MPDTAYQRMLKRGTQNPDARSMSDRLRPPYITPLSWLEPQNVEAASIF